MFTSLCTKGILWSPRYNLQVESNGHRFEAWADMTNDTKRDFKVKRTELFGGDVQLQESPSPSPRFANCCYAAHDDCCCSFSSPSPEIVSQGELAGIYSYSIDQPFVLVQQSTFSLPFVQATIELEKYAGLVNYFQERTQKGKFQRKLEISQLLYPQNDPQTFFLLPP